MNAGAGHPFTTRISITTTWPVSVVTRQALAVIRSGFLASDLAAEPRVFTEQGRPSDDTEERSMEAVTVAPEEPSAAVGFSGRTGHWAKVVPAFLVHERLPFFGSAVRA